MGLESVSASEDVIGDLCINLSPDYSIYTCIVLLYMEDIVHSFSFLPITAIYFLHEVLRVFV